MNFINVQGVLIVNILIFNLIHPSIQAFLSVNCSHAQALVNVSWNIPESFKYLENIIAVYGSRGSGATSNIPVCKKNPYTENSEGAFSRTDISATVSLNDTTAWWYLGSGNQENSNLLSPKVGWELIRVTDVGNFSACLFINSSCEPWECKVFNVTQPPYDFLDIEATHTGRPVYIRFNFWSWEASIADWIEILRVHDTSMNSTQFDALVYAPDTFEYCWFYSSIAVSETEAGGFFTCPGTAGTFGTMYGAVAPQWGTMKLYFSDSGPLSVGIFPNDGWASFELWAHSYICGMNVTQLLEDGSLDAGNTVDTESYLYYEVIPFLDRPSCHSVDDLNGIPFELSTLPMATEYVDTMAEMSFLGQTVQQTLNSTIVKMKVPITGLHQVSLKYMHSGLELSRFNVTVRASEISPPACQKLTSPPSAVPIRTVQNFTFQAQDFYFNKISYGGHGFVLEVSSAGSQDDHFNVGIVDHSNGLYTVEYSFEEEGRYFLAVTLDDAHLIGSPFQIYAYDESAPECTASDLAYSVTTCLHDHRSASFEWKDGTDCQGGIDLPGTIDFECDHVEPSCQVGIMIIVLSVFAAAVNFSWLGWLCLFKSKNIVKYAQPLLCKLFVLGCATSCLVNLVTLGPHTYLACLARPWLFHLPITFSFSCLFAKVYRVHRLFGNKKLRKLKIDNKWLLHTVAGLCSFEVAILLVRSFVDAPSSVAYVKEGPFFSYTEFVCESNTTIFQTASWTFKLILLSCGCYLAFVTKDHDRHLAEGQYIALAIYNVAILSAVAGLMVLFGVNIQVKLVVETIAVTLGTTFGTCILFLPKFLVIHNDGDIQTQNVSKAYTGESSRRERGASLGSVHPSNRTKINILKKEKFENGKSSHKIVVLDSSGSDRSPSGIERPAPEFDDIDIFAHNDEKSVEAVYSTV